jgi:Putative zinc-finger
MECRRFRDIADSYLSEELLVETNHEVLRHLETCPTCRGELAARRQVRRVLRSAFARAEELQPPPDLTERVRQFAQARIAGPRPITRRARVLRWMRNTAWSSQGAVRRRWAVAAMLFVAAGAAGAMVSQAWGPISDDIVATRSPTGTPTGRALMEVAPFAAGDHRECALQGRPESWVALDEASRRFDPVYAGLADVVRRDRTITKRTNIADVVDGHSCVFQGRRFGHVMLKHAGRLVSVLVTNFAVAQKSTGLARLTGRDGSRRVAACSQNADFRVACFRSPHHAVFVVSDLGEQDNLAIARSVAPSLQQHLAALGEKHASYGTSGLGDLWSYSERTTSDEVVPSAVVVRPPTGP